MLLPKSATESDIHAVRHTVVLRKSFNFTHLLLSCLIVLITLLLIRAQQERLCRETVSVQAQSKSLKESLKDKAQVFCLIFISQPQLARNALKVKRTWSKHCNHELFVSSNNHEVLEPLIIRQPLATPGHKWKRLRLALRYVHENHLDQAGWFLLAYENK
ncbi:unnamed protein product [Ceratitis capitata]|uniref:(Mediterranean fruit fly) hypothetical protein n=1 Tax=Ceratitis capitata TaxID=7213 RepID=A0A811V419_CERCA|nr:unnamed protein product [Ceratitis capitata]